MPSKIPIELLLKYSRQEVGELKSEIDELKFIIKEKDKEINKLSEKLKKYQDLTKYLAPPNQVRQVLRQVDSRFTYIQKAKTSKKESKRLKMYKHVAKYYNAWYDGCKSLLSVLEELRTMHFD